MSTAEKLRMIANTIQSLEVRATYQNMNHLMGVLEMINDMVRDAEAAEEKKESGE